MDDKAIHTENADATRHVVRLVKRSGSSFYWAMRLLPAYKRNAMFAIYAFCREVDDIADGDGTPEAKAAALDSWQEEIARLFAGRPARATAMALFGPIREFALNHADFDAVIAGMRMDAVSSLRITDWPELMLYCERVACAVGRLSNAVFGVEKHLADPLARELGEALQLTNILRDVYEDAHRDRVYLPSDLLQRHGVTDTEPEAILAHPGLASSCTELAGYTEERFARAEALMRQSEPSTIRPALAMKVVYHDLLRALTARGWARLSEPIRQSKLRKSGLMARTLLWPR